MAEQATARRRGRRGKEHAAELAELRARRDELDAKEAERRAREDAALERYVVATGKIRQVHGDADLKVAELERQAERVRQKAKDDAAVMEAEQAAALLELAELGRSAEELAQLTGIAVKRVRTMIRDARKATTAAKPQRVPSAPSDPPPATGGKDVVVGA